MILSNKLVIVNIYLQEKNSLTNNIVTILEKKFYSHLSYSSFLNCKIIKQKHETPIHKSKLVNNLTRLI